MIVGVSLILVVFSYLAYRRLQCPTTTTAAAALSSMWPFLSILRPQTTTTLHERPDADDDTSTPKANPITPALVVPEISLDDDDDPPPSFPALHSAQRAGRVRSSIPAPPPSLMMPPPPRPRPSAASQARQSSLAVVGMGAAGVAAGNGLKLNGSGSSKSRKVTLEPGHSPLDWARLQKSCVDLRGLSRPHLLKVPPSMLARHRRPPEDIWMALDGKVYNVTAYIPFHPGGDKELLRGAGKDGTKLFTATHPWVNVDGMLAECLVGILVSEDEARQNPDECALESVD